MDEQRFNRIENRLDEVKDTVAEVKAEQKVHGEIIKDMRSDFKEYTELVKTHVTGDTKIINEIIPLLEPLRDMVKDYAFKTEEKRRKNEKIKHWATRLGLITLVIGVLSGLSKLF